MMSSSPRFVLPADQKFLVLEKKDSASSARDGEEDRTLEIDSSKLEVEEFTSGSNSIKWYLKFELDTKKYVLDVKNDAVTARQYTGQIPAGTASFVPKLAKRSFEALTLESDSSKGLAVTSMKDKTITIKELKDNNASAEFVEYIA